MLASGGGLGVPAAARVDRPVDPKGRPPRDLPRDRRRRPDARRARPARSASWPSRRSRRRRPRSWADAAETNRRLLELGPDSEAENRLAKALWELGELGDAREHYQKALALDPTNRIAERNIDRLKMLLVDAGEETVAANHGSKAPVSIFVEETGKTGFAHLTEPRPAAPSSRRSTRATSWSSCPRATA